MKKKGDVILATSSFFFTGTRLTSTSMVAASFKRLIDSFDNFAFGQHGFWRSLIAKFAQDKLRDFTASVKFFNCLVGDL